MLHKVCMLLLLHLFIGMGSTFASPITITMPPKVSIEGSVMTLGQVSDISGDDENLIQKLREFKIGNAPTPGSSVVLTNELLVMRLASLSINLNNIVWQMPDIVTVSTRSQTISGQVLLDTAVRAIEERSGPAISSGDLSITPLSSIQDVVIPMGESILTSELPSGIRYNSPTSVIIAVRVNGQIVSKISHRLNVKLYQQVAVTTSQISIGEILTTDKMRYERLDIGRLAAGFYTDMNKVQGLVARRSLSPGMVVTESMIKKPLLIKRGNIVNIVARIGSLEVTAAGQAMQDGSEGQLIRVQNINSTKIISAKVLDASTVQVLTYKLNGV